MEHFLYQQLGELQRLGSNVDERKDRADYAYEGRLPADGLGRVEGAATRFIAEGHEVRIRIDPSRPGIRVWSCGGIEMPCGGTPRPGRGGDRRHQAQAEEPGEGRRARRDQPRRGLARDLLRNFI